MWWAKYLSVCILMVSLMGVACADDPVARKQAISAPAVSAAALNEQIFQVREEVASLQTVLNNPNLSEEQRATISEELQDSQQEFRELRIQRGRGV